MRREQKAVPFLPVSLLVGGRDCLVVGGGSIATRKVRHLLAAEAKVLVIAPELDEGLCSLVEDGAISHDARTFVADDVQGKYLVFAATDSEAVNADVIDVCRESGVLCSAIDSNWPRGDVVMPAVTRKGGVTVSVSTGGRSCTQARDVKERIAAILDECIDDDE